jgi:O-antigen/teichoic acid export membrane protein
MNAPFRARATTIAGLDDQASLQDILFRGTRMLTFVGFALGSILFVHAEHLLVTWMNPEFGAVASVLRVLLIGLAVEISVLMLGGGLFATGRLQFYAISNLCEAGGIIVLATLLARRFGLDGAAYGIMIPLVINKGIVQPAFLLRFLGVPWIPWVRHGIIPPVIALGAALIPILLLFVSFPAPDHLSGVVLQMLLAGLVHLAAGWFVVLRAEERDQAMAIIRRRRG